MTVRHTEPNLGMRGKISHYSIYPWDMVFESRNNERFVFKFRKPFTQICLLPVPQTPKHKPQINHNIFLPNPFWTIFNQSTCHLTGTAVAQWLRCCATNRKIAGSIPADVNGFFIYIKSFRSHYGHGVDSASNRNEYREYFLGVKEAGA